MSGYIYENDEEVLKNSIDLAIDNCGDNLNFVECGCNTGKTSKTLIDHIESKIENFIYYGIDLGHLGLTSVFKLQISHPKFKFVQGYSFIPKTLEQIPDEVHWIFIDGCHCAECVIRDAKCYIPKLVKGGIIAFHDTSPLFQGKHPQRYKALERHHNTHLATTRGVRVLEALESLDYEELGIEICIPTQKQLQGGVQAYVKS